MRALRDVNVLIALLDPDHSLHERAITWFTGRTRREWASCPMTQNGCVRIMSHPRYPNPLPVDAVMTRLREPSTHAIHEFWPDDVTILDGQVTDSSRIHGPRRITDIYLLVLAVRHDGQFVTFDPSVSRDAVKGADKRHLSVL